jgi:hypothetical protein
MNVDWSGPPITESGMLATSLFPGPVLMVMVSFLPSPPWMTGKLEQLALAVMTRFVATTMGIASGLSSVSGLIS